MPDARTCPACGAQVAEAGRRCPRCGAELPDPVGQAPPGQRRRSSGWIAGIAAVGALFIAGIIYSAVQQARSPAPVVQDLHSLLLPRDGQRVVVCAGLGAPATTGGVLDLPLEGPNAANDGLDTVVVITNARQYAALVPPASLTPGTNVEVAATVHVVRGPGTARIPELLDPTRVSAVQACPTELVAGGG